MSRMDGKKTQHTQIHVSIYIYIVLLAIILLSSQFTNVICSIVPDRRVVMRSGTIEHITFVNWLDRSIIASNTIYIYRYMYVIQNAINFFT